MKNNIIKATASKVGLPEDKIREVMDSVLSIAVASLMEGEEWRIGGIGRIRIEVGDSPTATPVLIPSNEFMRYIESHFVENRSNQI